jgi:cysteinyl-tRNA synthetase
MSKSLGNFFTIKEVLGKFPPEVVRFFLISSHYRSPLDFSDAALAEAETALLRLYAPLARIQDILREHPAPGKAPPRDFTATGLAAEEMERLWTLPQRFDEALDDDVNTAQALGYLFDAVRLTNRLLENPTAEPAYLAFLAHLHQELTSLGYVLNLLQADPGETLATLRQKPAELAIAPEEIDALIARRTEARKNKDWGQADKIRDELIEMGILLEDTPEGTVWKVK